MNPAVVEESAPEPSGVSIECVKVQPGGKYLLALLSNGSVRFWNTETKVLNLLLHSYCRV